MPEGATPLSGERIEIDVRNMMIDSASIIAAHAEDALSGFREYVMAQLSIDLGFR